MNLKGRQFLISTISLLRERLLSVQKNWLEHKDLEDHHFYDGVHLTYYEIFSTLNGQLDGFQINKKDVNFNINPDKDILSFKLNKSLNLTKKIKVYERKVTNEEIYLITDFICYLKEDAFDAKKEYLKNKRKKDSKYYEGKLFGYWEVFDTLKNQLIGFQIDLKDVKFDFDHNKELII